MPIIPTRNEQPTNHSQPTTHSQTSDNQVPKKAVIFTSSPFTHSVHASNSPQQIKLLQAQV